MESMSAFKAMRTLRALRPLRAVSRWEGMRVSAFLPLYADREACDYFYNPKTYLVSLFCQRVHSSGLKQCSEPEICSLALLEPEI